MIFISHATPEDNEFSRWLALRLANEGYPVWCDLTKLLGGEDFWNDIEDAIRKRTIKFLFVLSRSSNKKTGVLQELAVAKQVGRGRTDFILPLKIDDLPHGEINIELSRLNAIDFSNNWIQGFFQVLEKLETDAVQKDARFSPSSVAHWWREHMKVQGGVTEAGETCAANWFKLGDLPEWIYLHSLEGEPPHGSKELPLGIPNYRFKSAVFAFENAQAIRERLLKQNLVITNTLELRLSDFQASGCDALSIPRSEAKNVVTNVLRRGFEMSCANAGLKEYAMANETKCFWFPEGFSDGNRIDYIHLNGRKTYRRMVGFKTLQPKDGKERFRTWHFGIQGKVVRFPELMFAIKSHVVFSEEGQLYESKARQHSARRGQCKMWHNDTWLDRMLAAMTFLADPNCRFFINIPLGENVSFTMQTNPLTFESPVSYESGDDKSQESDTEDDNTVGAGEEEPDEEIEEFENDEE